MIKPQNDPDIFQLCARGATATPKRDRQIQIEGMFWGEAAETANQETAPISTPKTIENESKMKPQMKSFFFDFYINCIIHIL